MNHQFVGKAGSNPRSPIAEQPRPLDGLFWISRSLLEYCEERV